MSAFAPIADCERSRSTTAVHGAKSVTVDGGLRRITGLDRPAVIEAHEPLSNAVCAGVPPDDEGTVSGDRS